MDRRSWFRRGLRDLGRALADGLEAVAQEAGARVTGGKRYVRPPGALPEAAFLISCNRCGKCAEVCPKQAIKILPADAGAALGTPYIDAVQAPCHMCLECTKVCPTGALAHLTDKRQVKIGRAVLNPETCWAYRGQLCDVCYWQCPLPDEALKLVDGKPQIVDKHCTGCGICAHVCPSAPISIRIVPHGE